jgi:hypothetical protein
MLPADVSDRRFSETDGLEIYRHSLPVYRIPMLQVAAFFITFQNTLTFKIPSYAMADSVYGLG